jgi:hypothetical protein
MTAKDVAWGSGSPGTYRSRGGALVHVRRHRDGDLVIEAEQDRGRVPVPDLLTLVKLSEDPYWPDLGPAHAGLARE